MDSNPDKNKYYEYIVEKYSDLVYKICMTKLYNYNRSSVADACQNVFLNYFKSKPKFKNENHEKAWFIRISINCCTDIYRKQKYRDKQEENVDISEFDIYGRDEDIDGSLYEILSVLPEKIKYAVYLFYIEEYTTAEIAKILNTTSAAVRMRLKRGREILKDRLEYKYCDTIKNNKGECY